MALTQEQYYEALVESGGVSREDFEAAANSRLAEEKGIGNSLVARGAITDEQFGQLMSSWYDMGFINLRREEISEEILKLIPESFARAQRILPLSKSDDKIRVAIATPENVHLKTQIEKYLRGCVQFVFATPNDIDGSLYLYHRDAKSAFKEVLDRGATGEAIVIELVNNFFEYGYQNRASDIHIEPEDEFTVIRFRVDGVLSDISDIPKELHEQIISRLKVLGRLATDEHRAAQDGKIEYKTPWDDDLEIRLSIIPTTNGEKAVMRLLSAKAREFSLSDLGLSERDFVKMKEAAKKPWGMILATGPTGSGKTTSLYSILKILNKREVNISTIEDPVEYDIEGINQIQVNIKTDLTFAKGLRSIVRQDPDIIMVGEIRDAETADIAVNAAMTGHLVLSTLHTNDAATTFPRLKDMGVEDFLVASTVVVIIAQRLVRKICLKCINSYNPTASEMKLVKRFSHLEDHLREISGKKDVSKIRFFKGRGCDVCHNTGYLGRSGLFEVMIVSDAIRESVMQNRDADEINKIAVKEGMRTMLFDGAEKITLGITTIEEVLRVTQD
ncbi:MAG: ATPase, T2SS/T4P/T4SS family [Candidatus Uhrbacteria bacterium]|nr:ATPase, T2SS/T4P/T4SS family [Candidatus Uhrbacteria bacterium]